jgi:hypothetical protein
MTYGRAAATVLVAFVVSQILAVLIHGFVLAADYAPYYGSLLRGGDEPAWQFIFLPVAHLSFVISLVWVYGRLPLAGGLARRGITLGVFGWAIGQVPLYLLWYAEAPWPDSLVWKQLGLELVASVLIGMTVALIARPSANQKSAPLAKAPVTTA